MKRPSKGIKSKVVIRPHPKYQVLRGKKDYRLGRKYHQSAKLLEIITPKVIVLQSTIMFWKP